MCSDDLDRPEFWNSSTPVAKKRHRCCECGSVIPVGERHNYVCGKWDGDFSSFRTHQACMELRDFVSEVVCGGHGEIALGGLLEEIQEAGSYLGQDRRAWEAAGLEVPNPLLQAFDEIKAHYRSLRP